MDVDDDDDDLSESSEEGEGEVGVPAGLLTMTYEQYEDAYR